MNLALSTSCFAGPKNAPEKMIGLLKDLRIHRIELEYRIHSPMFHTLLPMLKEAGIGVTSLHNYCPFPALIPRKPPSGDYFRLSAPNQEERKLAVQWTQRTMEHASDLEAGVVVLHSGAVEMPTERELFGLIISQREERPEKLEIWRREKLAQRERLKAPILDALLFSLDQLLPASEKYGVKLGIENRYYLNEMPNLEEMMLILTEFRGAPIGYWHDTGHAHAQELLEIYDTGQWLSQFGENLCGIHLHDAQDFEDHLPPGDGRIDFDPLKPFVQKNVPLVLELAAGTDKAGLERAVAHARSLWLE